VKEVAHDGLTRRISFPDLSSRPVHRDRDLFHKTPPSIEQVFYFSNDDPVGSGPLPAPAAPSKSCLRSPPRVLLHKKVRLMPADSPDRPVTSPPALLPRGVTVTVPGSVPWSPQSRGTVTVSGTEAPLSPAKTRFQSVWGDGGTASSIFDY
jgi:hypothetical protein